MPALIILTLRFPGPLKGEGGSRML
ncbi:protein of unknown function [Candidatus Hydrogenisulfobacillus filiaventi]|uniref:Uncharacterized protein n=1 Tax=Candidatus Hydrogenisulfobacillus filiaventi TaxID=2707344 RepID=A0A6F8ZDT6_9FIRM|nr:protein of unknown function [Candidatus Hydrogenisulfobacillus filiaventi]